MQHKPPETAQPLREVAPIADRTRKTYLSMFKTAMNASVAKRTTDWEEPAIVGLMDIVGDFFSRTDISKTTRATMRSAIIWVIQSGTIEDSEDARSALAFVKGLKSKEGPPLRKPRPKSISQQDLETLMDQLYGQAEKSMWSLRTVSWIRAGLACGARPIEWLNVQWVDATQTQLRIKNAKVKLAAPAFLRNLAQNPDRSDVEDWRLDSLQYWEINREGEGAEQAGPTKEEFRIVPIETEADRQAINIHLDLLQAVLPDFLEHRQREEAFQSYYENCRKVLTRACRTIWGGKKLYSLYTMRGQFSANMKAAKGADATAELMGHSSPSTPSASYYGKSNQAHPRFKGVRPAAKVTADQDTNTDFEADGESSAAVE